VFIGSNVANNEPVAMKYLYRAKKAGTKVVCVNPYREPGTDRCWVPSNVESALFGTRITDRFFGAHRSVVDGSDVGDCAGLRLRLHAPGVTLRARWSPSVPAREGYRVIEPSWTDRTRQVTSPNRTGPAGFFESRSRSSVPRTSTQFWSFWLLVDLRHVLCDIHLPF
jgi:hypothetical protein